MAFGKRVKSLCPLQLDGNTIEWVNSWTYLGVTLVSHTRFNCSMEQKVKSFYKSLNSILRIEGQLNKLVMLRLLESHCIPILSYGIEVIHIADVNARRQLRVAYNSVFRRIFGYRKFDSVSELQSLLVRPTWEELVEKRKTNFVQGIKDSNMLMAFS